jgi:hypothetical protein
MGCFLARKGGTKLWSFSQLLTVPRTGTCISRQQSVNLIVSSFSFGPLEWAPLAIRLGGRSVERIQSGLCRFEWPPRLFDSRNIGQATRPVCQVQSSTPPGSCVSKDKTIALHFPSRIESIVFCYSTRVFLNPCRQI